MDIIIRVFAFIVVFSLLGGIIYTFLGIRKVKKMQQINKTLNNYVKKNDYLLLKNGGENPCENDAFSMPAFSQKGDYIVRRKSL